MTIPNRVADAYRDWESKPRTAPDADIVAQAKALNIKPERLQFFKEQFPAQFALMTQPEGTPGMHDPEAGQKLGEAQRIFINVVHFKDIKDSAPTPAVHPSADPSPAAAAPAKAKGGRSADEELAGLEEAFKGVLGYNREQYNQIKEKFPQEYEGLKKFAEITSGNRGNPTTFKRLMELQGKIDRGLTATPQATVQPSRAAAAAKGQGISDEEFAGLRKNYKGVLDYNKAQFEWIKKNFPAEYKTITDVQNKVTSTDPTENMKLFQTLITFKRSFEQKSEFKSLGNSP